MTSMRERVAAAIYEECVAHDPQGTALVPFENYDTQDSKGI
jgi:hypothetical protein